MSKNLGRSRVYNWSSVSINSWFTLIQTFSWKVWWLLYVSDVLPVYNKASYENEGVSGQSQCSTYGTGLQCLSIPSQDSSFLPSFRGKIVHPFRKGLRGWGRPKGIQKQPILTQCTSRDSLPLPYWLESVHLCPSGTNQIRFSCVLPD